MTIIEVKADTPRHLQDVADVLAAAKKVVVFTGAAISTNCGIPVSFFLESTHVRGLHFVYSGFPLQDRPVLSHWVRIPDQGLAKLWLIGTA